MNMPQASVKKPNLSTVIQPMDNGKFLVILPDMPETIVDRIHQRLAGLGINEAHASRLASPSGSADTIRNIRRTWNTHGKISATAATLEALASVLKTSVQWLLTGDGQPDAAGGHFTEVPVLSWVAASGFAETQIVEANQIEKRITISGLGEGDFIALNVVGDSMNLIAPEGSTIIVNRARKDLIDRKFYVVSTENGDAATFKRFREDWPPRLEPFSTNTEHQTINIAEPIRIVGRVVKVIHDIG